MNALSEAFGQGQQFIFEQWLQPLMVVLGLQNILAEGYAASGWLLVGLLQLLLMVTVMRALQVWRPAQQITDARAVRTDILYTLIHRLGLFRVLMFFSIDPLWDSLVGELRLLGFAPTALDRLWPGVTDVALISFVLYLLLFDFVDYWYHRASHQFNWWWALHALHHSQRDMTYWTDNRNHVLDDMLRDTVFVLLALTLGVAPGQFVALVAVTQLVESLSHANVRLGFGPLRWLLVSPQFHRLHHAMGQGHESAGPGTLGGHNFAVLFPVWDMLFGTARWGQADMPPGIRDQLDGRDYGRGFWSQQWLGLRRLVGRT